MFDEHPVRAHRDADRQADAFFADLDLRANVPPRQKEELAHTTHRISRQLQVLGLIRRQMFGGLGVMHC